MDRDMSDRNKATVLEAFDTLFNRRDYARAEQFWSTDYIQHSSRIPAGRDGLFGAIKSRPAEFAYEPDLIMAEGDMVMLSGRFSGHGAGLPWIVVNIIRMEDGLLKEHWDVIEDESTRENSLSGLPMFGDSFPEER